MNDDDFMSWYYLGGGWELYNEMFQKEMKYDVVGFATQKKGPEMLGWFKKPVKSVAEFRGIKFRTSGLTAQVFKIINSACSRSVLINPDLDSMLEIMLESALFDVQPYVSI